MGGAGAFRLAAKHPDRFCSAVSVSGTFYSLGEMKSAHADQLARLWADAAAGVISSLPLLAAAFAGAEAGSAANLSTVLQLGVIVAAGCLAYLATLRLAFRGAWDDLGLLARRTFGRSQPA